MARTPYSINSYVGGAYPLYLAGSGIGASDTSLTLSGSMSSWSGLGVTGGWYLALGYGTSTEEKIYVAASGYNWNAGNTIVLSGITRGVDSTTAVAQASGTIAVPVFTSVDISEANRAANALYGGGTVSSLVVSGAVVVGNTLAISGSTTVLGGLTANSLVTLQSTYENVVVNSTTALSGSNSVVLNTASGSFYYNTLSPSGSFTITITGAPTTAGKSATFALLVNNGSTAYLPNNITINGSLAGASSSALPGQGATNNNITTYYQGGVQWTSADASTLDSYNFTVICTATGTPNSYTLLAGLTKF